VTEYQEYLMVGKGDRCVGLTVLPPLCSDCHVIWNPQPPGILILSETSWFVQARTEIALPYLMA
jgi:hypothetical protein